MTDITTALINHIENEYRKVRLDGITPSKELLYSLTAISSIGVLDRDRYINMLVKFIQEMSTLDSDNFKIKYQLSGDIYSKLSSEIEWPIELEISEDIDFLDEEAVLTVRRQNKLIAINKLRDEKIDNGFEWNDHIFQSRASDRENIIGSAVAAQLAIAQGATIGNYRWANPDEDFKWITADNTLLIMDAFDVLSLYAAGIKFKTLLTFYARSIKDALLSLNTLDEVLEFDITTGWPF